MSAKAQKLIDELGRLKAKLSPLALREEAIKRELEKICKKKNTEIDGAAYRGTVSFIDFKIFEADKVRKYVAPAIQKRCQKSCSKVVVKVVALKSKR